MVDPFRRLTFAELDARTDAIMNDNLHALEGSNHGQPGAPASRQPGGNRRGLVRDHQGRRPAGLHSPAHGRHELEAIRKLCRSARLTWSSLDAGGSRLLTPTADHHKPCPPSTSRSPDQCPFRQADADLAVLAAESIAPPARQGADPDAIAVIQLSGGTTALPKLIPRRHAEYWYNALATAERFDLRPGDRIAHKFPLVLNLGSLVLSLHRSFSRSHAAGGDSSSDQIQLPHSLQAENARLVRSCFP